LLQVHRNTDDRAKAITEPVQEVADTSGLTDADWLEINKLADAFDAAKKDALANALGELAKDPVRYVRIIGAIYPDMMRDAIRDNMAAHGITEDDLRELIRTLEGPRH
jgi:hypothetical protein